MLQDKRALVLYGPPGTGKTFIAQKLASHVQPDVTRRAIVQLHPSYAYEDFFEGYRPVVVEGTASLVKQRGPLRELARLATEHPKQPVVLLLDEMNRGNLPRVFGELFFLLEYRDQAVTLMYSPEELFKLPKSITCCNSSFFHHRRPCETGMQNVAISCSVQLFSKGFVMGKEGSKQSGGVTREDIERLAVVKQLPLFARGPSIVDQLPRARGAKRLHVTGLFAGIGGLELGLARAGHETDLLCEIDRGAAAVLRARFPEIELHDDVCKMKALPRSTNLVVAGFPCQDLSQAGKTIGIEGSRSGLVGEIFRLLRKRAVPWVLLENVPFMLQLSRGRAMDVIVSAMEDLGYRWAYRVVNSRAFGLPQRRERVLFLASLEHDPREILFADDAGEPDDLPDPLGKVACGFYWTEGIRGLGWAVDCVPTLKGGSTVGIPSPPAIVLPNRTIVTPDLRDAERMQGFEPGWTAPSSAVVRNSHRWKLVGNAVTVDVAHWLGRRLTTPSPRGREVKGEPLERVGAWPKAAWNVGEGRFVANISTFPARVPYEPLHEWLRYEPSLLSPKATRGFFLRTKDSTLRFPPGFLGVVEAHLRSMDGHDPKRERLAAAN